MRPMLILLLLSASLQAGKQTAKLFEAVTRGDGKAAIALLQAGADPNGVHDRETILNHAVAFGDEDLVGSLLEKGARIEGSGEYDNAMARAISLGRVHMLRQFIQASERLDFEDRHGRTPLLLAVRREQIVMTRMLLAAGADPDHRDHGGNTALHVAVLYGHTRLVPLLLESGASLVVRNQKKHTPRELAAFLNHAEMIACLDGKAPAPVEKTIFDLAADGDLEALRRHDGALDSRDEGGRTALIEAAWARRLQVARFLLDRGVDPDAHDRWGSTALTKALWRRDGGMVHLLLRKGATCIKHLEGRHVPVGDTARDLDALVALLEAQPNPETPTRADRDLVQYPVFLSRPKPVLSPDQIVRFGYIIVEAEFHPDGAVTDISVLRTFAGPEEGLEFACIESIKKARFKPGTINGKPAPVRMTLKIDFHPW
ncbi:Ankyrin repeat domain-containing protein [Sulfidibacter corallicola]|uniref:Ankyrin repeat domain-containing protein n=1 Tax=Sulfidibacter corallicola TaxID=2818388 RepID=A0A8A4TNW0_SULCO|nr:ankyrin repeat domain-containing protein [Sulfidibacter corallicola]QTD50638.1 ankyrin repeat domain-containing protein [Sulfidibacter corallicola]